MEIKDQISYLPGKKYSRQTPKGEVNLEERIIEGNIANLFKCCSAVFYMLKEYFTI